jgi:hypothetical protein
MGNDIYQGTSGNTPLLEPRTYFGSLDKPRRSLAHVLNSARITSDNLLEKLSAKPEQIKWIERHAPDFVYWRDEFRPQYHLYVKRHLTANQIVLAQMIFTFTEPSHYPIGDEANWITLQ